MPTKVKIRISDNPSLRNEIDTLYDSATQIELAQWSLSLAKHICDIAGIDIDEIKEIQQGFDINILWQQGKARMHDVRQAGFALNRIAKNCDDELTKTALRTTVQAIGSGHMREHAMVASDYCVKVINLIYPNQVKKVDEERNWQKDELKLIIGKE